MNWVPWYIAGFFTMLLAGYATDIAIVPHPKDFSFLALSIYLDAASLFIVTIATANSRKDR